MTAYSESIIIEHEKGLHARPASLFVQTASEFAADVTVATSDGGPVDAKSSVEILTLGAEQGDELRIEADGSDGESAVNTLIALVNSNFEDEP